MLKLQIHLTPADGRIWTQIKKSPEKRDAIFHGLDVSIMANETTTKNGQGSFEPFNIDDIPWEQLPSSDRFKRLGRYAGGAHIGVGIDELGPGEYSNQFHYHLEEEEHIFILKGSATLYLGNHSYVLKKGATAVSQPASPLGTICTTTAMPLVRS